MAQRETKKAKKKKTLILTSVTVVINENDFFQKFARRSIYDTVYSSE